MGTTGHKRLFTRWTTLKVFTEFVTILFLFLCFWFFGLTACGILAPQPGIEPACPVLEGEVLTTGPPAKPQLFKLNSLWNRSPAQVGCMRQALGPGALGKPRGNGWRGRWEGGLGWGTHVNPWVFHFNVWQNPPQIKKKKIKFKKKKEENQPRDNIYQYSIAEGFFLLIFLVVPHVMCDLSSPTHIPYVESMES